VATLQWGCDADFQRVLTNNIVYKQIISLGVPNHNFIERLLKIGLFGLEQYQAADNLLQYVISPPCCFYVPKHELQVECGQKGVRVASVGRGDVRGGQRVHHGQDVSVVANVLRDDGHGLGGEFVPRLAFVAFEPFVKGLQPELPVAGESRRS
jgi:hypothetical protein